MRSLAVSAAVLAAILVGCALDDHDCESMAPVAAQKPFPKPVSRAKVKSAHRAKIKHVHMKCEDE